jgi:hypothetical protein
VIDLTLAARHNFRAAVGIISIQCACGAVKIDITGKAMLQYVCHCDDCQAVHGKAYPCSLHPSAAVTVVRGEILVFTLKTAARSKCKQCDTYLFAEMPGHPVRGINADLLPAGAFAPAFHNQCSYAAAPILDELPHYKGIAPAFGGSGDLMQWCNFPP